MEPKGIFPTVTLDIDTWNQERDQIVQKLYGKTLTLLCGPLERFK